MKDKDVDERIGKVWGTTNAAKADLPARSAKWRSVLASEKLKAADLAGGKLIFSATCGTCHALNGEGAGVGPDLTGSNRGDLGYLLENVLDPNAVIGKDYQLNLFTMKDGRVLGGIVKTESNDSCRVVMPGGIEFSIAKDEVKAREVSKMSTMPEGLFDALGEEQTVKLVAYLQDKAAAAGTAASSDGYKAKGAVEGEDMKVRNVTDGQAKVQNMVGFTGGRWSRAQQLWWTGGKPGAVLIVEIPVPAPGRYRVKAMLTKAKDYATVTITRNGRPFAGKLEGSLNLYDPNVIPHEVDWGILSLEPGKETLEIKIEGADPAAVPSYMFGLDCLTLEPAP